MFFVFFEKTEIFWPLREICQIRISLGSNSITIASPVVFFLLWVLLRKKKLFQIPKVLKKSFLNTTTQDPYVSGLDCLYQNSFFTYMYKNYLP